MQPVGQLGPWKMVFVLHLLLVMLFANTHSDNEKLAAEESYEVVKSTNSWPPISSESPMNMVLVPESCLFQKL